MRVMMTTKMIHYDRYATGLDIVHYGMLDVGLGNEEWR